MPLTRTMRGLRALVLITATVVALTFALPARAAKGRNALLPELPVALDAGGVPVVPLQPMAQILDATLAQRTAMGEVTVTRKKKRFACTPDSVIARRNGEDVTLPQAPFLRAGVLYVPLEPLITALGGSVAADADGKKLLVRMPDMASPLPIECVPMVYEHPTDSAEVYLMNLDGSSVYRLTYNMVLDYLPALSQDGSRLLFSTGYEIYLRTLGSPLAESCVQIDAEETYFDPHPQFSPDGQTIFYTEVARQGEKRLYSIGVDGSARRQFGVGEDPRVSPDGKTLAVVRRDEEGTPRVCLLELANGAVQEQGSGDSPRFSPDGRLLLYTGCVKDAAPMFSVVLKGKKPGTTTECPVGEAPAWAEEPSFSPDGAWIVFRQDAEGEASGLYLLRADFSARRPLTQRKGACKPAFTPDGKSVIFLADGGLYTVRTDGTQERAISGDLTVHDFRLTPDGRRLLLTADPPELLVK